MQLELPSAAPQAPDTQKEQVVEPLCSATKTLLKPLANLQPNDRLAISTCNDKDHQGWWSMQVYSLMSDGSKASASRDAALFFFERMPEKKNLGYGRWFVPATDINAIITRTLFPKDAVTFLDEGAKTRFEYLLLRFTLQSKAATERAAFKINNVMPALPEGWREHPSPNRVLAPYQVVAAVTSVDQEGFAGFMEQGTGKTPTIIRRFMYEAGKSQSVYRVLIACPKNVRTNWKKEIESFGDLKGRVTVLRGGALERVKQVIDALACDEDDRYSVVVSSYEGIQRTWAALSHVEWDLTVVDESHNIASPWAKRTQFMMNVRDRSKSRVCLTGTPFKNGVLDVFYQLEFLGEGLSGFRDWKAFRSYYERYAEDEEGRSTARDYGDRKLIGWKNLPLLQERLARLAFFITKKEAMPSLPDKVYDTIEAKMGKQQREYYKQAQSQLAVEIEEELASSTNMAMTMENVLTKMLRLSQITSGFIVLDRAIGEDGKPIKTNYDDRVVFFEDCPKLDAVVDLVKEKDANSKTIVWCCWIPAVKELSKRMTAAGIDHVVFTGNTSERDRENAQRRFNEDPNCRCFIGNPAAGGVGMNLPGYKPMEPDALSTNADHTVYVACTWSHVHRSQSEDRNHGRNRNRVAVRVTDLCVPGTIDDEIRERLLNKKAFSMEIQDVRNVMKRLLEELPIEEDE